jgi:hypothetical protein
MLSSYPMMILGLVGPDVLTLCRASILDSHHLTVEAEGPPALLHQIALQTAQGAVHVEFRGMLLILGGFTVFSQPQGRMVFQATHRLA